MTKQLAPILVPWLDFPPPPIDMPAAETYALINEGEFPLELHGDLLDCYARAHRVVGRVSARRGQGGKVVFTIKYISPDHEQMVTECFASEGVQPIMTVIGGSWPYKALMGIAGFHVRTETLPQGAFKPMVVTLMSDETEKKVIGSLTDFANSFKKTTKGVTLMRYVDPGHEGTVARSHACLGARRLIDLDELHLSVIRKSKEIAKAVKGCKGSMTWFRDNSHRTITIHFEGTTNYIHRAVEVMGNS